MAAASDQPRSKVWLARANDFFEITLTFLSRLLVLGGAIVLLLTFVFPLYQMTLYSNQFPEGLILKIYSYKLEGGMSQSRDDLREINALNHYIGMRPLDEHDFSEFRWIPLAVGAFFIFSLRAAVFGKMSKLIDVLALFLYFSLFSFWSFYSRLYAYGHELDPTAAVKVAPFTPPLFGGKQMANFMVYNFPSAGSYALVAFAVLLLASVWLSARSKEESR